MQTVAFCKCLTGDILEVKENDIWIKIFLLGWKDAFNIIEHKINEENSTWSEGFIAFNPEFFRLELLGGYRLRKYDGEEIKICNEEETQDFFAMKMQDYPNYFSIKKIRVNEDNYYYLEWQL